MCDSIILGMDLSLSCPAFCVAVPTDGLIEVIHISHLKTDSKMGYGYRLSEIYEHTLKILSEYAITDVVKEKGFSMHATTTAKLRGVDAVVQLAVYQHLGMEEYEEIAPTSIKKIVTGDGKATKADVIAGIARFMYKPVTLSAGKAREDEADAIATVISYALKKKLLV